MADKPALNTPFKAAPKAVAGPTLESCVVTILRGHTTNIATTVWAFEVPVLEEIHGEQSVLVVSSKDVPAPENFGAADAYAQLERKYSQHKGEVKHVYRNVQRLAKESGLPYKPGDEDTIKHEQASVIVHNADGTTSTGSGDTNEGEDA